MPSMPPLASVRVFEAAARHENFSRAAEELAMTQAGVSYQIKLLEERLGMPLFVRRGRRMELTAVGQRIAPRVIEAFATLDQAFTELRSENETVLSITTSRTFATNWLAERLGAFQMAHPDIAVRLDVGDQLVDLVAGGFDIAIRSTAKVEEPGLKAQFLMRQVVSVMASPEFLARHPLAQPADLLGAPRVSHDDEWWDLWFAACGEMPKPERGAGGFRFDSQVLDGQAALAGSAAAVLSPIMFSRAVAAGQLVQPFAQMAVDRRRFWLVCPEHKRNLAKVRHFRDWLLREVRLAVGDDDPDGYLVPPD